MSPISRHLLAAFGLSLALPAAAAAAVEAADAARGEVLAFTHHCMTCHGERGVSKTSRYPNLAGQHAAYLEARLAYFRSRSEPGNQMNAQAVHLSNAEIADLAAYFSAQPR
ncbi:MAG: c-type cytochrome [Pseudomonadales bacterium]